MNRWPDPRREPAPCSAAATEGQNRFGLRELLPTYADGFAVPTPMLSDAAAEMILAEFKRRIRVELDLLTLEGERMDL